jgi:hypothetical protein
MRMKKRYLTLLKWPRIETGPFDTGPRVDNFSVSQGDYHYSREVKGDLVTDSLQIMGWGPDGEPEVEFMSVTCYLHGVQVDHYRFFERYASKAELAALAALEVIPEEEMPF